MKDNLDRCKYASSEGFGAGQVLWVVDARDTSPEDIHQGGIGLQHA